MKIEEKTYQKITPEVEGNYLTTFQDGDDIRSYEGAKVMYPRIIRYIFSKRDFT